MPVEKLVSTIYDEVSHARGRNISKAGCRWRQWTGSRISPRFSRSIYQPDVHYLPVSDSGTGAVLRLTYLRQFCYDTTVSRRVSAINTGGDINEIWRHIAGSISIGQEWIGDTGRSFWSCTVSERAHTAPVVEVAAAQFVRIRVSFHISVEIWS